MKYWVTYRIDARYEIPVEADSAEDALTKAEEGFMDADFGDIHDVVESEPVLVMDEHDQYVWEK